MREIRYIYILIGIALCLQSCHRESHPNNPDAGVYAISMVPTSVQGASRALINSIDDLQTTGFVVYGHSAAGDNKQQVFGGDEVTFDSDEAVWSYTDGDTEPKYWNAAADYSFGAYAPQMAGVTKTETDDIITSLSIPLPQWQQVDGSETDLIVATSQGAAERYLMAGGTVNLDFSHVYAQLTVEIVRNAFLRNEYRLRSLAYKDVPASGNGSYTLDYTTPANSGVDVAMETDSVVIRPYAVEGVLVENEVTEATRFKYMVVPFDAQRAEGFRITLRYTNSGTEHYAVVNSGLTALEAGSSYTLRLSFDNGADILPTVELLEWTTEDTSDDEMFNW